MTRPDLRLLAGGSAGAGRREGGPIPARKDGTAPSSPTPPAPAHRHPRTGRFLAHDCEIDCLEHCAGPCGALSADRDPEPMELGAPIAAYYAGDPRHEDDDYGDVDADTYQRRVRDLRDELRAQRQNGAQ